VSARPRARPLRAALLLASLLAAGSAPAQGGVLAARVNGAGISRERLDRYTEEYLASRGRSAAGIQSPAVYRRFVKEALDQLIEDELMGQEAKRLGFAPSEHEVEREMTAARKAFTMPVQFELRLERSGFTEESYRAHLARQMAVARLVEQALASETAVSDAEVHDWYLAYGAATGQAEQEARGPIRERLRRQRLEAAVRSRVAALRQAARVEIFVPVEPGP
jgi:parvulin-like peptidyl-prolyl isomerase